MDLYRLIRKEPEKKSALDTLLKIVIIIGAIAAAGLLVAALCKKLKECKWFKSKCCLSDDEEFIKECFCGCEDDCRTECADTDCCGSEADKDGSECCCCGAESQEKSE